MSSSSSASDFSSVSTKVTSSCLQMKEDAMNSSASASGPQDLSAGDLRAMYEEAAADLRYIITSMEHQKVAHSMEVQELKLYVEDSLALVASYKVKATIAKNECVTQRGYVAEARKDYKQLREIYIRDVQRLLDERNQMQKLYEKSQEKLAEADNTNKNLAAMLQAAKTEHSLAKEQLEELKEKSEMYVQEAKSLLRQLKSSDEVISALEQDIEWLRAEFAVAVSKIEHHENEMAQERSISAQTVKNLERETAALRSMLSHQRDCTTAWVKREMAATAINDTLTKRLAELEAAVWEDERALTITKINELHSRHRKTIDAIALPPYASDEELRRTLASASMDDNQTSMDDNQTQSGVNKPQHTNDSAEKRPAAAELDKERLQRHLATAVARARQSGRDLVGRTERQLSVAADERECIREDYGNNFSATTHKHGKQMKREKQRLRMKANETASPNDRKQRLLRNSIKITGDSESLAGEPATAHSATPSYASATQSPGKDRRRGHDARTTASSAAVQATAETPQPKLRKQPTVSATPGTLRSRAMSLPPSLSAKWVSNVLRNNRRSRSASADRWLDHTSPDTVGIDILLLPNIETKHSASKLKVLDTKDSTEHLLTQQEADAQGVLQTRLVEGIVIPSAGRGGSVVSSDVETLKQTSPGGRL